MPDTTSPIERLQVGRALYACLQSADLHRPGKGSEGVCMSATQPFQLSLRRHSSSAASYSKPWRAQQWRKAIRAVLCAATLH